ncbi:PAS domain-containing protein, partial [Rhodococcus koreensis]|uniref:PAS domain-containing protein n=1 Tax=Rhodococcus koreensis TaxID=99653 RepID=UPI00366ABFB5
MDSDELLGSTAPPQGGSFRFYLDGQRWEWSDPVARMHGYQPGEVTPTTELLLSHKHPDDQAQVAALFDKMIHAGEPFSSKHRIIDTDRRIHHVIVV